MFKAVLFDLDGTLLNIDMDYFLKQYFNEMMKAAVTCGYSEACRLVEQVWKSTAVMIANRDPLVFNEEAFMSDFLPQWGYPEKETRAFFEIFYDSVFPRLYIYSRPFSVVPSMMEKIFARGLKVVIATNAVFPRKAIEQRLQWAGIGAYRYDLITSYEVMHFCKPHREYYQEIADLIDVAPEHCIMVGNDKGEDLTAGQLGMKTYLVDNILIDNGCNLKPDWQGNIDDLSAFINKI